MKKLEDMKNFNGWSDDDLLDELDILDLELSCLMGTEEGDTVEKMFWMVMGEVERRGIIVDKEEEKEKGMVDSLREDKIDDEYVSSEGDEIDDEGLRDNLGRSFDEWGDLPF